MFVSTIGPLLTVTMAASGYILLLKQKGSLTITSTVAASLTCKSTLDKWLYSKNFNLMSFTSNCTLSKMWVYGGAYRTYLIKINDSTTRCGEILRVLCLCVGRRSLSQLAGFIFGLYLLKICPKMLCVGLFQKVQHTPWFSMRAFSWRDAALAAVFKIRTFEMAGWSDISQCLSFPR